ncbi:unnamed protein product [Leptidea sinapis]|uniref:SUN domain-containing protein n=1 Tax=Leptidea sinapis TaxID=189913 RepID=A0A5E4R0F6_9NEOP|nr:unnamed protein product [Leptidea sinapis]
MDYDDEQDTFLRGAFKSFVCVVLSLLLGFQVYSYLLTPHEIVNGDFSDIKHIINQLSHGLSEINRKHEQLQFEMDHIASALPAVAAAADRAKDALGPPQHQPKRALDLNNYDRQVVDYALETAGGRVIDTGDTIEHFIYESPISWALYALSAFMCRECLGATTVIRPGALPGECWAFKGPRGEVTIRLLGNVRVTGVSLEHISPQISPTKEISSAPRLFQVEGLEYRRDVYPHDFGTFEYNKDGKPIQYFDVKHPSNKGFDLVRIKVISNWGHSVYTCVYRVRVHGELVQKQPPKTFKEEDYLQIDKE